MREVTKVSFKGGSRVLKRSLKDFLGEFHGSFKEVLRVFKDSAKCVPRKFKIQFQEFLRMFQLRFCNVIVAWISSKLPEQKKGLF